MELSKVQTYAALIYMAVSPVVTYHKAIGDIRESFVKKDEIQGKLDKIDTMAEDLAELKGWLEGYFKPRKSGS